MNFKIYIIAFLLILPAMACNKNFLDRAPYDGVGSSRIFENDANATLAVNGIYQSAAQTAFKDPFLNITTNLGPDSYSYGRAGANAISTGMSTSRAAGILNLYTNFYQPIMYANDVIAGLNNNEKVTEALRNRLTGEAKFFRGLCYFYLWNYFGEVVILDKPMPVDATYLPRSSVADVTALIISDFKDAAEKLPVSYASADLGRATSGAAIAMLGKTYLYLRRWPEAEAEFAKLLQEPYTYDLTDNFGDSFYWKTQNNKESVFELQYTNEAGMGSSFEKWYGNRSLGQGGEDYAEAATTALSVFTHRDGSAVNLSTIPKRNGYPAGNTGEVSYGKDLVKWYDTSFVNMDTRLHQSVILPGSTFYGNNNAYYKVYWPYSSYINADTPALRTTWYTQKQPAGVIPIRKFMTLGEENILNPSTCPTNFPLVRFADVLLMYAEAVNEARGPVPEVYDAVNRIRERAKIVDLAAGLGKDQMQRAIRLERYKELMFETHLYFDVKRWHIAHLTPAQDPVFSLNNDVLDFRFVSLSLKKVFREDRDYLFPIPGNERDLNPLLTQNPNWD
ncbi:RagB/SusD family nutrient uptake outer membrane protein [Niabella drilacis]|uniref:Starch-binding associating with outer membrane n=1 Tax=Niabella drilacis (strain DSM 25811 / CCM 8410 / CCUG 62505 / LMG 26954 / E90) TaxID=1285928 RepID=A0A1G6RI32_NIADE|nr:RagB/SusD family nutrient uptake outer membrane protein [Niabella drilacis]SDD03645.1 Starch-binding associating with outer membrane [Niabella drilacis]